MVVTNIRVIRYTTTPESVEENIRLVSEVYAELDEIRPDNFRYATVLLPDENTFLHLAIADGDAKPLPDCRPSRTSSATSARGSSPRRRSLPVRSSARTRYRSSGKVARCLPMRRTKR